MRLGDIADTLRAMVVVVIIGFLVVFALVDSRSAYTGAAGPQLGLLPLVASFGVLLLAASALLLTLADRSIKLGLFHLSVLLFVLVYWLAVVYNNGFMAGAVAVMVAAVLMAFSVQGAGRPLYLVAAKWALRVVVFGSLLAGVFFPDWALVPFGVSDRSLFGFSTRLVGLATSPNYLGLAAATLLIVELTSASKARRLLSAAGLGVVASLAVAAYVMLWAQSRGVIIAAFVAALSLLLSRLLGQSNWAYVASSWLAVGSSALVVFWIPGDVFLNDSLDDSSSGRVDIWASVLSSWDQYRLFGVSQNSATLIQYGAGNAHNGLLELLVTGGMPLLSAALVLFISSSVIILRAGSAGALAGVVLVFVSWQFLFGTPLRLTSLNWNLLVVILLVGACSRASFTQLVSSRAVSTSC